MNSFFKKVILSLSAVAAMAFASSASATCVQNCPPTTTPPVMPSMGLTIQGWSSTGAASLGETTGYGKVVTGEVVTTTNEQMQLGAESFLTGNNNPDCNIDCRDSQSKLSIKGISGAGAQTVGYAKNDGTATGCGTNACPPTAASMSQSATKLNFMGSVGQGWTFTPAPAPAQ